MKSLFISVSIAVMGSVLAMSSHADPMAVFKGRAIFIAADNHLTVLPDIPNQPLTCSFDAANGVFIPGAAAIIQIPLPGAVDVKVIGGHAYVATSLTEGAPTTGYAKYDVSACIPDGPFAPYKAHADLASGKLVIPCVEINGIDYNVIMNRRGNSMNWEVNFYDVGCH
jgi:hypothetical protein